MPLPEVSAVAQNGSQPAERNPPLLLPPRSPRLVVSPSTECPRRRMPSRRVSYALPLSPTLSSSTPSSSSSVHLRAQGDPRLAHEPPAATRPVIGAEKNKESSEERGRDSARCTCGPRCDHVRPWRGGLGEARLNREKEAITIVEEKKIDGRRRARAIKANRVERKYSSGRMWNFFFIPSYLFLDLTIYRGRTVLRLVLGGG